MNEFLAGDHREMSFSKIEPEELMILMVKFQTKKDREYNKHWARRGLLGYIHGCMLRQSDRLEPGFDRLLSELKNLTMHNLEGEVRKDHPQRPAIEAAVLSILDTLLDVAIYAMLGICLLTAKFPEVGEIFLEDLRRKCED